MRGVWSLRSRLTAIILTPLLAVAVLVGLWQVDNARRTATDVFDRSLLAAALAVANDVAISGGDALSPRTRDILADTSGGPVFYHVYAPDGVIVAGYATPPVGIPRADADLAQPRYFEATYRGRPVHGVRLQNQAQIDGFSGIFTTTVWQDSAVRQAFVRDLMVRAIMAICGLIAALALIVWFGVRIGLRPLDDLQEAIADRSGDDLSPIQRPVPVEVAGIVTTLNRLFGQVTQSMSAQSVFISNAAHQLRNPIAGVLSLAEAVHKASSLQTARHRAADLLDAARETAALGQKLLLLDRAKSISPASELRRFDMDASLTTLVQERASSAPDGVDIQLERSHTLGAFVGDETMICEALRNLVDNAIRHGGDGLTRITVTAQRRGESVEIAVRDDGQGLKQTDIEAVRQRFGTLGATAGSGLGLSIAEAVAEHHRGTLDLRPEGRGLVVALTLTSY